MNKLRNLLHPKVVLSGLALAVVIALGYGLATQKPAQAAVDCDNNAVIKCGFTDLTDFGNKYHANPYGDLQNIYGNFTGGSFDVNAFKNSAKHATVYKDGRVVLDDGTVVATGANSLGRQQIGGNRYSITIADKTYYYSSTRDNFGPNSLDGYALMNADDHSLEMVALKACGNPVWGNSPGYKCQMLQQTKVNDTTYHYVATPYTKNGSTVTKIVYDFGDGSSQTVTSNFGQTVSHTYTPGDYIARATVYFKVNGQDKSDTRAECTKPVHVAKPAPTFTCTSLIAKQVSGSRTQFAFTATGAVTNGAVLQSGTFIFDDGTTDTQNANGNTVVTNHDYSKEGDHITKVDLTFNVGKDVNNQHCVVTTTTLPPTCKDTPTKPECVPCQYNSSISSASSACQPPQTPPTTPTPPTLPSTGPEEVVGTVLGLGSITGAGAYYRASRQNWLSQIFRKR